MFSLLALGVGASLNFNQMSNKAGLVEKKLSLIYGVSCKQESTLGSPSLPAYVFLLHCSGRASPYLSAVKTSSVSPFSFLLKCCKQLRCGGALSLCFLCSPFLSKKQRKQSFEDESLQEGQQYGLEVRLYDKRTKALIRGVKKVIGADL